MRHPHGSRFERRLRARREALANAMTPQLPAHLREGRPRYGVGPTPEEISERERLLQKFGQNVDDRVKDRRSGDRRKTAMTPSEVDDWMKRNGISGGDRRKGQRRQGDRRQ